MSPVPNPLVAEELEDCLSSAIVNAGFFLGFLKGMKAQLTTAELVDLCSFTDDFVLSISIERGQRLRRDPRLH